MLSILPPRNDAAPYQIIVIDHEQALMPVRNLRQLPAVYRSRGRRIRMATAAAAAFCAALGFGAGMMFGDVPAPPAPSAPRSLANVGGWSGTMAPLRVEPLSIAGTTGAAPQLAGWITGSGMDGRGVRVQLLRTAAPPMTLAIELHAEPRMAMLRAVSSRAFDIEIGPFAGHVRTQEFAAPDGVAFIRRVTVQKQAGSGERLVRVRVNLDAPGQGNLRVAGRTIYADFAPWSAAS